MTVIDFLWKVYSPRCRVLSRANKKMYVSFAESATAEVTIFRNGFSDREEDNLLHLISLKFYYSLQYCLFNILYYYYIKLNNV